MRDDEMRVGVAGCGSIGARYVAWLASLGAVVTAYDTSPARRAAARAGGAHTVVDSLPALLESAPARLLVATPPAAHAEIAIAALQAGIDVLVEKPLAPDLAASAAMLAAAATSPASAWVVCNMRFHEGPLLVRRNLAAIGRPLFARAHFGHRLAQMRPADLGGYAGQRAEGGGVVLDCIHEFDYLRWMFGAIDEVDGCTGALGPEPIGAEDYAEIRLRHASGVRVALHLDFLMRRKRRGLEVHGTEGSLLWSSEGKQPERCTITYADRDTERILHSNPQVNGEDCYLAMLRAFLHDPGELQTLVEAADVLAWALRARGDPA